MSDALEELRAIEGLAPRESILARALTRHGLAPPDRVLDAARATAADPSGDGVLDRLSAGGILTEERAEQIERALEKKMAARQAAAPLSAGAQAGGDAGAAEETEDAVQEAEGVDDAEEVEVPAEAVPAQRARDASAGGADATASEAAAPPADAPGDADATPAAGAGRKRPRMWKPRSRHDPETGESVIALYGEMQRRREDKERKAVDKFMELYVRSRLHQIMIEKLARMRAGVADPKALARAAGVKEKQIIRILKDWKTKGLLTTVGTFPYYYDPPAKVQEAAQLFLKAWRSPADHQRLLMKLLEYEG